MADHEHRINHERKCAVCGRKQKHIMQNGERWVTTVSLDRFSNWQLQQQLRDEIDTLREWEKAGRP